VFARAFFSHMHMDVKPEASLVAEPSLFCARPPAACRKEGLRSPFPVIIPKRERAT
jgi:hypothetical protein